MSKKQRNILTTSVSITKLQNRRQSALIIAPRRGDCRAGGVAHRSKKPQ